MTLCCLIYIIKKQNNCFILSLNTNVFENAHSITPGKVKTEKFIREVNSCRYTDLSYIKDITIYCVKCIHFSHITRIVRQIKHMIQALNLNLPKFALY